MLKAMDDHHRPLLVIFSLVMFLASATEAADIFLEWNVTMDWTIKPVETDQLV